MKKFIIYIPVFFLTGCAYLHSVTYDAVSGKKTTSASAIAFFDSQSALTKFQNRSTLTSSNEWSPGTSIGSLQQNASSTNLDQLIGVIVGAAVKAAAKP